MEFLAVLAIVSALCYVLRSPIRKAPGVLYAVCFAMVVLFAAGSFFELPVVVEEVLFLFVHKCTLAMALFAVVMFVGVFPRESVVSHALRPIRTELSIAACIMALGHMFFYLSAYLPRVLSGGVLAGGVGASFAVAIVLFVLLLVLGVTSFSLVKRQMSADAWRRLQKFAYLFYGLIYVHLVLMLTPAALAGSAAAMVDVAVYTALFGAYAVLRVVRWRKDAAFEAADACDERDERVS